MTDNYYELSGEQPQKCFERTEAEKTFDAVFNAPPLINPVHRKVYVVGALKNPIVPILAATLRDVLGWEVFDDWHAAHPQADNEWQNYERSRGRTYEQALLAPAAQNVFQFDKLHLNESTHGLLVLPAGRSGHLELGYLAGNGATTAILLDGDYDRWDVMYGFADLVTRDIGEVIDRWKS